MFRMRSRESKGDAESVANARHGAPAATPPLLQVDELAVRFGGEVDAVRGVSFSLDRGDSLAIVGESGSGKSTLALCLAGLIHPPESRGSVKVNGLELLGARDETLRAVRWAKVALALQGSPFNPVTTLGDQVTEPLRDRLGMSGRAARTRAEELAREVLLDPDLLDRYPHQVSGGQRRRATLAMVLTLEPDLVVLDEPTAGLDPSTRHELVQRIVQLADARRFALIVISHDLPDAAAMTKQTMVMYAGEAMESGATERIITEPAHPYSWALINAYPVMTTTKDLRPIRGRPPDPRAVPPGCPYNPRCTQAEAICLERPPMVESPDRRVLCHFGGLKTLLSARGITRSFGKGKGAVTALNGVSITVREGESVGVVGPSGSGKSTLARILSGHLAPDSGAIDLEGETLPTSWRGEDRLRRRRIQLVMQDPADALSPRLTVEELVREPLDVAREDDGAERRAAVSEALLSVGLPGRGTFLNARTHELSGGQLQRIALARALVIRPKLLVADEPTAMLDASEQARLLVVLRERQVEMGMGLVLISHDLAVVRKVTDRIIVLDRGRVVEEGPADRISTIPSSSTARLLVEASPAFSIGAGAAIVPQRATANSQSGR